MKVSEELRAELKAAEAIVSQARAALDEARLALRAIEERAALSQTAVRPGDIVEYLGAQWKVSRVQFSHLNGHPRISGYKLKKDGTPGALVREMWGYTPPVVAEA